jgi:diguanylate cyclase (GGDEF)-like protein
MPSASAFRLHLPAVGSQLIRMKSSRRTQIILTANAAVLVGELLASMLLPVLGLHDSKIRAAMHSGILVIISTTVMYFLLRRSELELELANRALNLKMKELNARADDNALLEEMGALMLATRSPEETYQIVPRYIGRLFPGTQGGLYVLRHSRDVLEQAGQWGKAHESVSLFSPEECWAFRRGKLHYAKDPQRDLYCTHLDAKSGVPHCCVPMIANGESLGLLHIEWLQGSGEATAADSKLDLVTSVAEHIALALSNNRLQQKLENQSIRDPLTGLFNRRFLEESLNKELHRAQRKCEPVGLLMIDLDHFKAVNDEYGHDAGDAVLRAVAVQLQKELRLEDVVCRLGGEEFVIILPGISLEKLEARADIMLRALRNLPIAYSGRLLKPITASMGLACYPQHGTNPENLLCAADSALYISKNSGRNRATVAANQEAALAEPLAAL